jgi:glycosyltransferase involved in cell wall biosynthesis
VIPHGVDVDVFKPGDQRKLRRALELPLDARIVLFVAQFGRFNKFKDYGTLEIALRRTVRSSENRRLLVLCIGGQSGERIHGAIEQVNVPFVDDPATLAKYYGASDLYAHPAREDTFPNTILEAMACGVPAVAANVGGIPEQVVDSREGDDRRATGCLFKPGNPDELAATLNELLDNNDLRALMSRNSVVRARERFSIERCLAQYETWLVEIVKRSHQRSWGY